MSVTFVYNDGLSDGWAFHCPLGICGGYQDGYATEADALAVAVPHLEAEAHATQGHFAKAAKARLEEIAGVTA